MLFLLVLFIGIFILGSFVYKLTDYYAQRYLALNPSEHRPIYTPGRTDAPALVCVLGWGGSTRRQLRRLLEFYSSQGIPTVSWINPMFNYLFGVENKHIEHLLDLLIHENQNSNNKIIIHLHSNNGALAWGHMLNTIKTNERYRPLLSNIKGVILDSAPYVNLTDAYKWLVISAISSSRPSVSIILNRVQYYHVFWTPLLTYYFFIKFFYRRYFSTDPFSASEKIRKFLNETPTDIKQLYLYSDSDRLVPANVVEYFMKSQTNRGAQVKSHRFADSTHVNHFRLYPKEYGKLVLNFIVNI